MAMTVELEWSFGQRRSVSPVTASPDAGRTSAEVALVLAARRGDRSAFAELHGLHARMVHGILLARVPAGDAEDLVQDVFLKAMRSLAGLRAPESFGAWLAGIARNRANDFHRRRRPAGPLPDEVAGRNPPTSDAREALEAIRGLPEAYRESLLMRLVEGMTGPEIAARLGLTPGSVRVNLHRGMKLLRESLGWKEAR